MVELDWHRPFSRLGSLLALLFVAGFAVSLLLLIQVTQAKTVSYLNHIELVSTNVNNSPQSNLICSADLNQNGVVDNEDVDILRAGFGNPCSLKNSCRSDLNGDYAVDNYDVQIIVTLLNKECMSHTK